MHDLRRYLATCSHDLRTPLTAIVGYADLLEMGVPEPIPDGARECVSRIREAALVLQLQLDALVAGSAIPGDSR